jgi:flagellar biosynthesis/type III secretory pathway chaperone
MQPKQNPAAAALEPPAVTRSPTAAAGGLIEIAARLVEVMNRETDLLRTMKVRQANDLFEEKTRLVHGFEERARALKGDPTLVGTLSAELKGELQAAVKRFDQAAEANALAIRIARDANQHLLNAIVDAVAAKQAGQNGYGATGAPANPGRCTPKSLSLALDGRV